MDQHIVLFIVFWFLTFMLSIECCKTKWINPQLHVVRASTTARQLETMTTTTSLTRTMTTESEFVSSETTTTVYNKKANQLRDHSEMYEINRCLGLLDEVFCINGGKCINYTMRDVPTVLFLSCECADGFMGERCESKYLEGTYKLHDVPKQHKINTVDHHIYHRRHPQHHYESMTSSSLRSAQVHPEIVVIAGIVLVVSHQMLIR